MDRDVIHYNVIVFNFIILIRYIHDASNKIEIMATLSLLIAFHCIAAWETQRNNHEHSIHLTRRVDLGVADLFRSTQITKASDFVSFFRAAIATLAANVFVWRQQKDQS